MSHAGVLTSSDGRDLVKQGVFWSCFGANHVNAVVGDKANELGTVCSLGDRPREARRLTEGGDDEASIAMVSSDVRELVATQWPIPKHETESGMTCPGLCSLCDLRTDYLDTYLVHWPFPKLDPPGCDVSSRSPDARPYAHNGFMETWQQMERLASVGLVRDIGTSDMTIPKLDLLLRDPEILPAVNEMVLHPTSSSQSLRLPQEPGHSANRLLP
jgi:hypothetical protein